MKRILVCMFMILAAKAYAQRPDEKPYLNTKLPIAQRVDDLISRMTLEEKVHQLFNQAPAIPRLGVPAYNWWNECLHGVARAGKATVFPQAIGLAATFDQDLMFRVGDAISDEARAKHHYFVRNNARGIYMGLTFWTPNINIFRDPRWGRGQETYGEDPYLTARMAVNFIKGLQGSDTTYLKTIATAKHYAVHSGPEFTRHSDNLFVNDRDLYETYLPAFKATVREANVQSVMCAYNRFRDQPCCGSDVLLGRILRGEFGFKGYIVSDCGAITDFYNQKAHHVAESPAQAWGWSIASGTDLNCEESKAFIHNIDSAAAAGIVNERDIDVSLRRLFLARFRLGMFDPVEAQPFAQIPLSVVGSNDHLALTLEAAEKSFVLLKNNGILPLKAKRIALIGPNANNPSVLIGNYNGDPIRPVTPLRALRERLGERNVLYSPGCPIVPGVFTDATTVAAENFFYMKNGRLVKGLEAKYYDSPRFEGAPAITRVDPAIDFNWASSPITRELDRPFSVRWAGFLVPVTSGTYTFSGNVSVAIDGRPVTEAVALTKGKRYSFEATLKVEAFWWASNYQQAFATLSWVDISRDYRQEALAAARQADVVIFCGGISPNLEGEEMPLQIDGFAHGDRTHIELPETQQELLKLLQQTGKPVVYVNFSGSAVALNWQQENLPAVVQGFYPGEATGTALVRLLWGDSSPSGRLPVTFYKSIDDIPAFKDYRMAGKTYRYFGGQPLYEFGYGLSYTTFQYTNLKVSAAATTDSVRLSVDVSNTGSRDGDEVVQVYVSAPDFQAMAPLRSLAAFRRVHIKKGEKISVTFTLPSERFSIVDEHYRRVVKPGTYSVSVGAKQPDAAAVRNKLVCQQQVSLRGTESFLPN